HHLPHHPLPMLYRITRHTALTSAHRPRLIESTHTTTILTRRENYPIPVPPLEVQQELVGQLKEIEATESQLALRLDMVHEMRRAAHLTALSME
ncbi:hypothetical protein ABZR18_32000, partial [Pseudomonas aeruginosa]